MPENIINQQTPHIILYFHVKAPLNLEKYQGLSHQIFITVFTFLFLSHL